MTHGTRVMVRPRHMALAAVLVAIALLIGGALEADAASHVHAPDDGLPSPMLLVPVMLAFAMRARG